MKQNLSLVALLLLLTVSCKKEIAIEYQDIEPRYVIEANLRNSFSEVRISQTRSVNDSTPSPLITTASVSIRSSRGEEYIYHPLSDGTYSTLANIRIQSGESYTLRVEEGEHTFVATSKILTPPTVSEVTYFQQPLAEGVSMIFCSFAIADTPNEENYYRYRLRLEGEIEEPNWTLVKDEAQDGLPLWQVMPLIKENPMTDLFEQGEEITIELQSIDRDVYNFFYSLQLSGNSGANPVSNIHGGCLGYFSACSESSFVSPIVFEKGE